MWQTIHDWGDEPLDIPNPMQGPPVNMTPHPSTVYGRLVWVVEDYRLRPMNGLPLPGDRVPGKDGTPHLVTAVFKAPGKLIVMTAPECLLDRAAYLKDELNGTTPFVVTGPSLKSPEPDL